MKAYHIMIFLFIFNLFFWVVTAGLLIYNVPGADSNFDLTEQSNINAWTIGLGVLGLFSLFGNLYISIGALATALAGGAMLGIFTAGQGSQGIVYGLFSYFFWSSTSNTLTVFYNLSNQHVGALYVLTVFGMIIAVIFVAGLFQMVTGGWKGFE